KLRALVTPGSRAKAFKIELNARIASIVTGPGGSRLRELEDLTKRNFFFVGLEVVHLDHFRVLDRGDVARLAPKAPVEVGQELEPPKKPAQRRRAVPVIDAAEPEAEAEEPEAEPEAGEAAPVKKKTRRGSRGGRNRKKKTAVSPISANGDEPESALDEEQEV